MKNNEELNETMKQKLNETNIIQGDNIKYRNLYLYNMEKLKNSHLNKKENQNKVNDLFSTNSTLIKTIDPNTLTKYFQNMVKNDKLSNVISVECFINLIRFYQCSGKRNRKRKKYRE